MGDFKVLIRGEERKSPEIQNRQQWPSNTAGSIICLIGSRKELFLHQRMPHKEIVRLENTAGMLYHRNMQHCCRQHHITWSKCILKVAMKKKVREKKSPFIVSYFYSHWTPPSHQTTFYNPLVVSCSKIHFIIRIPVSCSIVKNVTITHPNRQRSNTRIAWSSS